MIANLPRALAVAEFLGHALEGLDIQVTRPMPLEDCEPGAVCFANEGVPIPSSKLLAGALLLVHTKLIDPDITHIVCPNPRLAFALVLRRYFMDIGYPAISPSASIRNCSMGEGCIVKAGAVIGEDGFGFERDSCGVPVHIPHIGRVVIGKYVEVGANTVIARGTMGDTVIEDHVKLDDQVFVAHNVKIGSRTMVVAKAEISGSVRIGEDAWIGPAACIRDHITIGHHAFVGMGAVVVDDVKPYDVVVGNPARVLRTSK